MKRKIKKYCISNHEIYIDKCKNMAYVEVAFPLGSTEIDQVVALLTEKGYINKYYGADKKSDDLQITSTK